MIRTLHRFMSRDRMVRILKKMDKARELHATIKYIFLKELESFPVEESIVARVICGSVQPIFWEFRFKDFAIVHSIYSWDEIILLLELILEQLRLAVYYISRAIAVRKAHKTLHKFHLVDPSPWPFLASLGAMMVTTGGVLYMHRVIGGKSLLLNGLLVVIYVMYVWWRDIVREAAYEDVHTFKVQRGLRLGVVLFIVSEVMFFFGFFWAFFHSSLSPVHNIGGVWPPTAIAAISSYLTPLTNTVILLSSGATITWAHHSVILKAKRHAVVSFLYTISLAVLFTQLQGVEYASLPFNISDGIYGSCFYMTTGFHGFHVFVGTIAIMVSFTRLVKNHFTATQHLGLESAVWYWHFVDVVWIFLFATVYWWSNLQASL